MGADHRPVLHEAIWAPMIGMVFVVGYFLPDVATSVLFCPLKRFTDIPCLTCGATRAIVALCDGRVLDAFALNPMVSGLAILGFVYCLHSVRVFLGGKPWRPTMVLDARRAFVVRGAVVTGLALNWAYLVVVGR